MRIESARNLKMLRNLCNRFMGRKKIFDDGQKEKTAEKEKEKKTCIYLQEGRQVFLNP